MPGKKFKQIRIDNSKEAAVMERKWKDPGSELYYDLLNTMDDGTSDYRTYLKEAYLIAPVNEISNSPYGTTPFSKSGCKYPHHVIVGDKLVVHLGGLRAAYSRAKQQGIFKGKVKEHLERHYRELGIYDDSTMSEEKIQENTTFIETFIAERGYAEPLEESGIQTLNGPSIVPFLEAEGIIETEKPETVTKTIPSGNIRKQLYIAFIEYAKRIHSKNTFRTIFDKDFFKVNHPYVPTEMRYFYRLANPVVCVLENELTFFEATELKTVNGDNDFSKVLVFAGTPDTLVLFNMADRGIYTYKGELSDVLNADDPAKVMTKVADSFDEYIDNLIGTSFLTIN